VRHGEAVVVGETAAQTLALAVFLDQAAAAALRREPAAPTAASPQVASWADRRAERVWEYVTAGDPEAVVPA
jgi:hypothetical protein